jgi:hypothetical protein
MTTCTHANSRDGSTIGTHVCLDCGAVWRPTQPQAERTCGECACFFANKNWCGQSGAHVLSTRIANDCRSFVPTQPSPVAGDCTSCGGPVLHRDGAPGEYDHDCSPQPSPAPGKDAGRCDPGCRHWSEPEGNPACSACDGVTDNYEPAPGKHPPISVSDGRGGEVDLSPLVKPAPAPEPKRERLNPDPLERLSPDREQALRNEAATYTYSLAACCVREIDALRADRDRLAAENEHWRSRFRAIVGEDRPDSAGNRVLTLQAENERLNDALVARALSEASSVEAETEQLRADLAEARRQLEEGRLARDAAGLVGYDLPGAITRLDADLAEARAENERLRGEKEKYVDEAVRRGEDGAHLVLRVGHVESALALIRDERDKLSDGLRAESARADRLERGPAAARAELDTLRTALSTVEAQWRDGQATIAELRGQLETRPVADLRQEADERAQLLAGRDATIAKLRRQLEQADHATIADQRGAIDALVSENNAQAARVAQLEGALETECDVSADRTWVGQYHCGIHGVWFRDDGKDVCECPVGKFARTAPQSPAASGGEKETKP